MTTATARPTAPAPLLQAAATAALSPQLPVANPVQCLGSSHAESVLQTAVAGPRQRQTLCARARSPASPAASARRARKSFHPDGSFLSARILAKCQLQAFRQ